jgi:hypothetical protein
MDPRRAWSKIGYWGHGVSCYVQSQHFALCPTGLCSMPYTWVRFGIVYIAQIFPLKQERPYHGDSTASRLLSEVKHHRAQLVLRWGTTLESWVLFFLLFVATFAKHFFCFDLQTNNRIK